MVVLCVFFFVFFLGIFFLNWSVKLLVIFSVERMWFDYVYCICFGVKAFTVAVVDYFLHNFFFSSNTWAPVSKEKAMKTIWFCWRFFSRCSFVGRFLTVEKNFALKAWNITIIFVYFSLVRALVAIEENNSLLKLRQKWVSHQSHIATNNIESTLSQLNMGTFTQFCGTVFAFLSLFTYAWMESITKRVGRCQRYLNAVTKHCNSYPFSKRKNRAAPVWNGW